MELAAVIDVGTPFVKATYKLEGDRPLIFECYDVLTSLAMGITTAHSNLNALCAKLSAGNLEIATQLREYGMFMCATKARLISS